MIAINQKTNKVHEGGPTFIGRTIGRCAKTLGDWEKAGTPRLHGDFLVIFDDVIREKQKKGFALIENRKNIYKKTN